MWLDLFSDLHPKLGASQNESAYVYGSEPDPFPSPLKMGKGRQRQTRTQPLAIQTFQCLLLSVYYTALFPLQLSLLGMLSNQIFSFFK